MVRRLGERHSQASLTSYLILTKAKKFDNTNQNKIPSETHIEACSARLFHYDGDT
jgi:hypothetical protein